MRLTPLYPIALHRLPLDFPSEHLPWPTIELVLHFAHLLIGHLQEIRALREVVADETVGVRVHISLPRRMRITERRLSVTKGQAQYRCFSTTTSSKALRNLSGLPTWEEDLEAYMASAFVQGVRHDPTYALISPALTG